MIRILSHFSEKVFTFDPNGKYKPCPHRGMFFGKPPGFWLSDETHGDGWKTWCEENEFQRENLTHETQFKCDTSRWFVPKETSEMLEFSHEFQGTDARYPELARHYIDWDKVKDRYAGILITPYCHSLRFHPLMMWYYGWDCASGCVWDLSTISQIAETQNVIMGANEGPRELHREEKTSSDAGRGETSRIDVR